MVFKDFARKSAQQELIETEVSRVFLHIVLFIAILKSIDV